MEIGGATDRGKYLHAALLQLAAGNPIRRGPHDQDDQHADCDIIENCHARLTRLITPNARKAN